MFTTKATILFISLLATTFFIAFLTYSGVRTLQSSFGFNLQTTIQSLIVASIVLLPIWCGGYWVVSRTRAADSKSSFVLAVLCVVCIQLLAACTAEIIILADELQFACDVVAKEKSNTANTIYRPRSWPNRSADLLYTDSNGFYAED
jgi:Na+/proline symporter